MSQPAATAPSTPAASHPLPPGATPIPGAETIAVRLPPPADGDPDQPRILLQTPINVRSISLVVVAVLASVWALHWAAAVLIPLVLALLVTYALSPLVEFMARRKVPPTG